MGVNMQLSTDDVHQLCEMLERVEWVNDPHDGSSYCAFCDAGWSDSKHTSNCILRKWIDKLVSSQSSKDKPEQSASHAEGCTD